MPRAALVPRCKESAIANLLPSEEYVEQAWFFRALGERMQENVSTQDLLHSLKDELLSTCKLPIAVQFMAAELKLTGVFSTAMARLPHYFTPFQVFLIREAEDDRSRFDFNIALEILRREAQYRAEQPSPQGGFLFQFETLSRHRLRYDRGLDAMAGDCLYPEEWRDFIRGLRKRIGMVDVADLIYVRSAHYTQVQRRTHPEYVPELPVLFGEKEGKIALANRRKDPAWLFAALQRHLGYPQVPRVKKVDETKYLIPRLQARVDRLEARVKLLEEEARGGIDITKFYRPDAVPPPTVEGE